VVAAQVAVVFGGGVPLWRYTTAASRYVGS
jgi:hypothetical protein